MKYKRLLYRDQLKADVLLSSRLKPKKSLSWDGLTVKETAHIGWYLNSKIKYENMYTNKEG